METHTSLASVETAYQGKFASPLQDIFMQNKYVGTVYEWDDGSQTTVWLDGIKRTSDCVSRALVDHRIGWRDLFAPKGHMVRNELSPQTTY